MPKSVFFPGLAMLSLATAAQDVLRSFAIPNGARIVDFVGDLDGDGLP